MIRRVAISVGLILFAFASLAAYFKIDENALRTRTKKAQEMKLKLDGYEQKRASLDTITKELGAPYRIETSKSINEPENKELWLIYRYEFQAFPWSDKNFVVVKIRFDKSFKIADYGIFQSFS